MSGRKPRSFAIIGLGSFGGTVARELARFGNYVIGIDKNEAKVNRLAEHLSQAVIADAREEDALAELGIGDYSVALIAMGQDLEGSIVSAMNVRLAGVETVWAKAVSKTHHRILSKIGVDRVILPEAEMGKHIAQMLNNPLVRDYVSLGNGYHVVNIVVPERLKGKKLSSLELGKRFNLRCLGVMEGSVFKGSDSADCALKTEDRLIILGERPELRRFADTV